MSVEGDASEEQGARRERGQGLGAEISRRVASILDAVEAEATQLRAEAKADAEAELARAREQADELVRERRRRIAELSDELVAKTEAILGRLEDAEPIYRRFERLIAALGDAADKLAAEVEGELEPAGEEYVPPRSSSFWRAARTSDVPPPPAGPIPAPRAQEEPPLSERESRRDRT